MFYKPEYSSGNGTSILKNMLGERMFDNPKPLELIKDFVSIGNPEGYILDFFAGSSTSAHAVIDLNLADGKKRNFIQVQLPEPTKEKSEAYIAGYKTIAEIGKERIRRAVNNIVSVNPNKSKNQDLGFKVFKLDTSNINSWDSDPANLASTLFNASDNIKSDRTEEDVLFEILLKNGLDLSIPIEERDIEGCRVYNVGFGTLFICLSNSVSTKVAEGIGAWKKELQPATCRVIFKDSGFSDVDKTNSMQILKRFGIEEVNTI